MDVTRDEALARMRSARVGRMATVTPEGRPHVVPFVFAVVEGASDVRTYWVVDNKPKRSPMLQRIRNIAQNPAVELVVDGYDEDWGRLWWVRASGSARVVETGEERREGLSALAEKYAQSADDPPSGPVVAIDIESITGWEA
jgi:PPOX class probable F420-dependent enzyme